MISVRDYLLLRHNDIVDVWKVLNRWSKTSHNPDTDIEGVGVLTQIFRNQRILNPENASLPGKVGVNRMKEVRQANNERTSVGAQAVIAMVLPNTFLLEGTARRGSVDKRIEVWGERVQQARVRVLRDRLLNTQVAGATHEVPSSLLLLHLEMMPYSGSCQS